jgi:hypothetical protein
MEELTIVKRRSRIVPILLTLLLVAILLLAALWMLGLLPGVEPARLGARQLLDVGANVARST